MSRTFRDAKHDPRVLVRDTAIFNGLKECVDVNTSTPLPETPRDSCKDYWNEVVRFLWLPSSKEKIRVIVGQLESSVCKWIVPECDKSDNRRNVGHSYQLAAPAIGNCD